MKYFYLDSARNQQGPVEVSELLQLGVTRSTLVWSEGMAGWVRADSVAEIVPLFNTVPPTVVYATPPSGNYVHSNFLVWSILATLFCCLPFGIVSIVYAANANSAYDRGDIVKAQADNKQARTWFWWSFGSALAIFAAYILLVVVIGVGSGLAALDYGTYY